MNLEGHPHEEDQGKVLCWVELASEDRGPHQPLGSGSCSSKGGQGVGYLVKIVDRQSLLASSLNAISLSLPGTISLADPTWRKHSTIWSCRGRPLAMEKNLAAGVGVVSLICSNP